MKAVVAKETKTVNAKEEKPTTKNYLQTKYQINMYLNNEYYQHNIMQTTLYSTNKHLNYSFKNNKCHKTRPKTKKKDKHK